MFKRCRRLPETINEAVAHTPDTSAWIFNAMARPGASFTNMVYLQSLYGYIITTIIECDIKLLLHSQTSLEVWEWMCGFISNFTRRMITYIHAGI